MKAETAWVVHPIWDFQVGVSKGQKLYHQLMWAESGLLAELKPAWSCAILSCYKQISFGQKCSRKLINRKIKKKGHPHRKQFAMMWQLESTESQWHVTNSSNDRWSERVPSWTFLSLEASDWNDSQWDWTILLIGRWQSSKYIRELPCVDTPSVLCSYQIQCLHLFWIKGIYIQLFSD